MLSYRRCRGETLYDVHFSGIKKEKKKKDPVLIVLLFMYIFLTHRKTVNLVSGLWPSIYVHDTYKGNDF